MPNVADPQVFQSLAVVMEKELAISDKNKNGAIDFEEALKFAAKKGGNKVQLKKDRKWFNSIDKNHDGVIKPNEFDKTLKN
uniref:EF-hand domain-containing protein n=1 Tax=Panagrolaimus superbus TaxID=310955 RepID=A0A914YEB7_9BILA